jgi:hypothetical protein
MQIERTPLAQQEFDTITDGLDRSEDPLPAEARREFELLGQEPRVTHVDSVVDMFNDDTPIEPQCDLENPDICESCQ